VGAVMKATKGKADPKIVNELIIKKLGDIWEPLFTRG
jgi:aspartyl-tRNA(Asn)/glutamyl-tRNA(Gln) amidotransferase subunit B